jgi:RimJ/RimL family protein N-acetyltransferase
MSPAGPYAPAAAPTLVGQRVKLRPYSAGFDERELRALYRWAVDDELIELVGGRPLDVPYPRFREIFLVQLPRHNSTHEQLFALLDEGDRLIGRTGLFRINSDGRSAELGICIGERDRWGGGRGREAVRMLADWGLDVLGLERIVLNTYPDNERAKRAFRAAGFRPVRLVKRFTFDRGVHWELEMSRERVAAHHGTG